MTGDQQNSGEQAQDSGASGGQPDEQSRGLGHGTGGVVTDSGGTASRGGTVPQTGGFGVPGGIGGGGSAAGGSSSGAAPTSSGNAASGANAGDGEPREHMSGDAGGIGDGRPHNQSPPEEQGGTTEDLLRSAHRQDRDTQS